MWGLGEYAYIYIYSELNAVRFPKDAKYLRHTQISYTILEFYIMCVKMKVIKKAICELLKIASVSQVTTG
jgi:hypothetical protein